MSIGDQATLGDVGVLIDRVSSRIDGDDLDWSYFRETNDIVLEPIRATLLEDVPSGKARAYSCLGNGPIAMFGRAIAEELGYRPPVGALCHRDTALPLHRDTQMPERCWNATLFLREGCAGGELVIPDAGLAFHAADGWALGFDGQRPHGVAPFTLAKQRDPLGRVRFSGYRLSLVYYCPRG